MTESIKAESADISAEKTTDAVSTVSNVNADTKVEKKAAGKKTSAKASVTKATAAKAPAKKKAVKKEAVKKTAAEIKKADDAVKSRKSVEELKRRAAAAKKRAQEKILEKAYVSDPVTDPLERLANSFHQSARRWEMVVYPSLFAFVLLAGYGFFLIYRLTHDISILSHSVTRMAVIVSDAMPRMSKDMDVMTGSMNNMTGNISGMSGDIRGMTQEVSAMSGQMETLTPLSRNISNMTGTMNEMNRSVYGMQRDMGGMNRTISSGPFGMMNDVMPFSSHTNVVPPLPPPTYRQPWEIRRVPPRAPRQMVPAGSANPAPDKNNSPVMNINRNTGTNQTESVKHKKITPSPESNASGLADHHVIPDKR